MNIGLKLKLFSCIRVQKLKLKSARGDATFGVIEGVRIEHAVADKGQGFLLITSFDVVNFKGSRSKCILTCAHGC